MTGITVTQQVVEVVVAPPDGPQVVLAVPAPPILVITPLGAQGPAGPPPSPGPGFVLVGSELRFVINTLPQG